MRGDKFRAPLSAQVAQLKRSINNRDRRRRNDRSRNADADLDDPYDGRRDDGASRRQSAAAKTAAAQAAIAAAAAMEGPALHRCDLCQVTMATEAAMRQHLDGAAHIKAAQRAAAQHALVSQSSHHRQAAQAAVEAGAWMAQQGACTAHAAQPPTTAAHAQQELKHSTNTAQQQYNTQHTARHGTQQSTQRAASGQMSQDTSQPQHARKTHTQHATQPTITSNQVRHGDIIASMAANSSDPLAIDGWVPPPLPAIDPTAQHTSSMLAANSQLAQSRADAQHTAQHSVQAADDASAHSTDNALGLVEYSDDDEDDDDDDSDDDDDE